VGLGILLQIKLEEIKPVVIKLQSHAEIYVGAHAHVRMKKAQEYLLAADLLQDLVLAKALELLMEAMHLPLAQEQVLAQHRQMEAVLPARVLEQDKVQHPVVMHQHQEQALAVELHRPMVQVHQVLAKEQVLVQLPMEVLKLQEVAKVQVVLPLIQVVPQDKVLELEVALPPVMVLKHQALAKALAQLHLMVDPHKHPDLAQDQAQQPQAMAVQLQLQDKALDQQLLEVVKHQDKALEADQDKLLVEVDHQLLDRVPAQAPPLLMDHQPQAKVQVLVQVVHQVVIAQLQVKAQVQAVLKPMALLPQDKVLELVQAVLRVEILLQQDKVLVLELLMQAMELLQDKDQAPVQVRQLVDQARPQAQEQDREQEMLLVETILLQLLQMHAHLTHSRWF